MLTRCKNLKKLTNLKTFSRKKHRFVPALLTL